MNSGSLRDAELLRYAVRRVYDEPPSPEVDPSGASIATLSSNPDNNACRSRESCSALGGAIELTNPPVLAATLG